MEILYHVPGDPELDARIKTMIKAVLVHYSTELCTIMVFYQGMWLQDLRKQPASTTGLLK
jgi:hypothetical protein